MSELAMRRYLYIAFVLVISAALVPAATPDEQTLIDHVVSNGGTVNADIVLINGAYRGLVAAKPLAAGDLIMAIPEKLTFFHIYDDNAANADGFKQHRSAVHLLLDMQNATSPHQVWWKVQPPPSDFYCSAQFFPREYCALLQSRVLDMYACDTPWKTVDFAAGYMAKLTEHGLDPNALPYAMSLFTTRYFGYFNISRFIPVMDMANHRNHCPNNHADVEPCPDSPEQTCVMFKAGEDLAPGQEVCLNYGGMWQDRALLQYGYLQPEDPPQLIGVDRHDFVPKGAIWKSNSAFVTPIAPFSATTEEDYDKEIKRLHNILTLVESFDAAAAHWPPARRDPSGKCLGMVLQFREHRKAALRLEIQRLQRLVAILKYPELAAEVADAASNSSEGSPAEEMEGWDPYTHAALMTGTSSNLHVQQGGGSSCGGVEGGAATSGTCAMASEAVL